MWTLTSRDHQRTNIQQQKKEDHLCFLHCASKNSHLRTTMYNRPINPCISLTADSRGRVKIYDSVKKKENKSEARQQLVFKNIHSVNICMQSAHGQNMFLPISILNDSVGLW